MVAPRNGSKAGVGPHTITTNRCQQDSVSSSNQKHNESKSVAKKQAKAKAGKATQAFDETSEEDARGKQWRSSAEPKAAADPKQDTKPWKHWHDNALKQATAKTAGMINAAAATPKPSRQQLCHRSIEGGQMKSFTASPPLPDPRWHSFAEGAKTEYDISAKAPSSASRILEELEDSAATEMSMFFE